MKRVFYLQIFLFFATGVSLAAFISYSMYKVELKRKVRKERKEKNLSRQRKVSETVHRQTSLKTRKAPEKISRHDLEKSEDCFQKGYKNLKEERLADAHRAFTKAAELAPIDARPHVGLAQVYEKLDYHQRAEKAYRKAIEIEPDSRIADDARVFLSRILCDFGKNTESIELLRKAGDEPRVWAEIAANELRLGHPEKAVGLLEKYNRVYQKQSWGPVHLGRAYADLGKFEKAESAYRRALAWDPHNELALLWLGQLLVRTGRKDASEEFLKKFRRLRQLQTKERELEQHIARRPDNKKTMVMLYLSLARVRELQGKFRRSLIPLKKATELEPDDERLYQIYQKQLSRVKDKP